MSDFINFLEIQLSVFVHEQVSKTHGLDHCFNQIGRQEAVFFKKVEHLVNTARHRRSLSTHNVSGHVDAILDGHLQVEAHDILMIRITQKLGKNRVALLTGSPQMLANFACLKQEKIGVNQLSPHVSAD